MRLPIQPAAIRRDLGWGNPSLKHTLGTAILPSGAPVTGPCNPQTQTSCGSGCCNAGDSCFGGQCYGNP
jgi:hypothetical protein